MFKRKEKQTQESQELKNDALSQVSQEPKIGFVQWCKLQSQTSFSQFLKSLIWVVVVGMTLCFIISSFIWVYYIGNGAYSYSSAAYTAIEDAINAYILSDRKVVVDSEGNEVSLTSQVEAEADAQELIGPDIVSFQEVVDYFKLETPNGQKQTELVATIKDGYFKATVTAELDSNYKLVSTPSRNCNSFQEYIQKFWCILILGSAICGVVGFLILMFITHKFFCLIAYFFAKEKTNTTVSPQAHTII